MYGSKDLLHDREREHADNVANSDRNANTVTLFQKMCAMDNNLSTDFKQAIAPNAVHQKYLLGATVYWIQAGVVNRVVVVDASLRINHTTQYILYTVEIVATKGRGAVEQGDLFPLLSQATAALNELNK